MVDNLVSCSRNKCETFRLLVALSLEVCTEPQSSRTFHVVGFPFGSTILHRIFISTLKCFPGYLALYLMKLAYLKNFGWCWLCPNERPCSDLWLISNELVSTDSPNHPKIENMAFLFRKVMILETTWTQRTTPGGW